MKTKLLVQVMILAVLVTVLPSASAVTARALPLSAPVPQAEGLPTDKTVASYDYTYYASGNISAVRNQNGSRLDQTQTYVYDMANRLVSAQASQSGTVLPNGRIVNGQTTSMGYDLTGDEREKE